MKHWKWIASTGLVAVLAIAYATADAPLERKGEKRTMPGANPLGLVLQLFDADENGEVTRGELADNVKAFDTLDKNQDGVLSAADFPRGPHGRRMASMLGTRIAKAADTDGSGDVTEAEWQALVATIETDDDGAIVPESLHEVLGIDHPVGDGPGPGPNHPAPTADDLNSIFSKLDRDDNGVLEDRELMPNRRGPRGDRSGRVGPDGTRGHGPRGPMSMADTDDSGDVSAAEWQTAFAELDTNGDGVLTQDELRPKRADRSMRRQHRQR